MTGLVIPFVPAWVQEQLRWIDQVRDDVRARQLASVIADRLLDLLRRGQVDEDVAIVAILGVAVRFADEPWTGAIIEGIVRLDSEVVRREARRLLGERPAPPRDRLLHLLAGYRS